MTYDPSKCPQCGKILASEVEAMPMCSLKYRLLDSPAALCYGHSVKCAKCGHSRKVHSGQGCCWSRYVSNAYTACPCGRFVDAAEVSHA